MRLASTVLLAAALNTAGQPVPAPAPVAHYFAVTAYRGDLESGFSNEVCWTNAARFEWAASTAEDVSYYFYVGRKSGSYSRRYDAGAATYFTYPPPAPVQDRIITAGVGTNVFYTATNPPGLLYFKLYHCSKTGADIVTESSNLAAWSAPVTMLFAADHRLWITTTNQ